MTRGWLVVGLLLLTIGRTAPAAAASEGELTWAMHVSLAPTWFDPAETPGVIVPFMVLYALHDALAKPMPGAPMAPSDRVVERLARRARLRLRAPRRGALPTRAGCAS